MLKVKILRKEGIVSVINCMQKYVFPFLCSDKMYDHKLMVRLEACFKM